MTTLQIIVALLRGTHVVALVSLFGTLVFLTLVVPTAMAEATTDASRLRRSLLCLAWISAPCALIAGIAWLVMESAIIAGTDGVATTLHAVPVVALRTQFGQWLLLRCGLLVVVLPLLGSYKRPSTWLRRSVRVAPGLGPWEALDARLREHDELSGDALTTQRSFGLRHLAIPVATVLAGITLAIQPMLGHAGATGGGTGTTLIVSEIMHLLAAGAWLGGLLPLFIAVGALPHNAAATACRSFTPVGLAAVLVLGGTAVVQVAEFMGGLPGLLGTGYGRVALLKLGLFGLLLVLAALNRLALTDRIAGSAPDAAEHAMRVSIATEAVLGAAVVITAGFLASNTPGTHEQPVWPFASRPSLWVFQEPDLRGEVIIALVAVAIAIVVAIIGVFWRRVRWPALMLAAIVFALSVPHLDLLLVVAYPTSFFTSPTEFAATAIAHGAKLYAAHCAVCHGIEGRGDGPAAKALAVRPADLTAEHLWSHSDGEMFWYISHGFEAPDGGTTMPGFAGTLSSEARWNLIDYLHARNAGESMRATGAWPHPLPVPQFDIACGDGRTIDLDDLRGRVLHIVALSGDDVGEAIAPAGSDVTTIILRRKRIGRPGPGVCVASEPEAWTAFAILSGVSSDALVGTQVLVDQNSWLRAAWRPGDPGNWLDARQLNDTIRYLAAHPIAADAAGGHVHRH